MLKLAATAVGLTACAGRHDGGGHAKAARAAYRQIFRAAGERA